MKEYCTHLTGLRIEHGDIEVVACNDPFIEPHYAVSYVHYGCKHALQLHLRLDMHP